MRFRLPAILSKVLNTILTAIGRVVLFIGSGLRFIWQNLIRRPILFVLRPVGRSFRSTRGKVRWTALGVFLIAIVAGLYVDNQPYNAVAKGFNSLTAKAETASVPNWLSWTKGVSLLKLPEMQNVPFRLGLDLVGGTQLLYNADTTKLPAEDRDSAMEGVRDVIERRVNAFGVAEPVVQTDKSNDQWRVLVELAGVSDVDEAIRQIGETPLLEFKEQDVATAEALTDAQKKDLDTQNAEIKKTATSVLARAKKGEDFAALASEFSADPGSKDSGGDLGWLKQGVLVPEFDAILFSDLADGKIAPDLVETQFGYHIVQKIETRGEGVDQEVNSRHILFLTKKPADILGSSPDGWKNTELSGKDLSRAQVVFDPQTQQPQIQLTFNDEGRALFGEITGRNIGKPVAIFLDGQVLSAPTVQDAITTGDAVISGQFTVQEARLLAQRLNAGALPVPITLVSQARVGATLGDVAVERSFYAGLYGFLLVAIFMILYYRLPGFLSVIALTIYVGLVLAIFKFWPVTLSLAGIAGFILSIGMAVDANVLIFERLKEELRRGRSLPLAIQEGFQRAWSSIFDSNMSSLITCTILWWFGTSVVKGFALTLALGILVSMFSAVFVTRTLLRLVIADRDSRRKWLYGNFVKIDNA